MGMDGQGYNSINPNNMSWEKLIKTQKLKEFVRTHVSEIIESARKESIDVSSNENGEIIFKSMTSTGMARHEDNEAANAAAIKFKDDLQKNFNLELLIIDGQDHAKNIVLQASNSDSSKQRDLMKYICDQIEFINNPERQI